MPTDPAALPDFHEKRSLPIRLWHWSSGLLVAGSFLTFFTARKIISGRITAPEVKEALEKEGLQVTVEQARAAARTAPEHLWDLHIIFGYCIIGFLAFRLLAEFLAPKEQRFFNRYFNGLRHWRAAKPADVGHLRHYFGVKNLYLLLYVTLSTMALTGLGMIFSEGPEQRSLNEFFAEVHETGMYVVLSFIVLHLVGVVRAEVTRNRGIVSDMINGGPP